MLAGPDGSPPPTPRVQCNFLLFLYIGPVFWLAFILLRAFPHSSVQWFDAKSSGLQQRGLRRNGCLGDRFTGFPFHLNGLRHIRAPNIVGGG